MDILFGCIRWMDTSTSARNVTRLLKENNIIMDPVITKIIGILEEVNHLDWDKDRFQINGQLKQVEMLLSATMNFLIQKSLSSRYRFGMSDSVIQFLKEEEIDLTDEQISEMKKMIHSVY